MWDSVASTMESRETRKDNAQISLKWKKPDEMWFEQYTYQLIVIFLRNNRHWNWDRGEYKI